MATNKGYFQILPNSPGDYKVAANVTIAGGAGLATFDVAQTSEYMGVGSRVEYNAGGSVGYVASKVDQSNWYLVDANGVAMGNQGASAVVSITADFASLGAAEAGFAALTGNADITAAGCDQDVCFVCYCEQTTYVVDAVQCIFGGPTCDATHEFFVYCISNLATEGNFVHANVDNGTWNDTIYRMQATAGSSRIQLENINILSVHIFNLQIYHSWAGGRPVEMFAPTTSRLFVEKNILRVRDSAGPGNAALIYGAINDGQIIVIRNNICYSTLHTALTGSTFYIFYTIQDGTTLIIGNTFHNFDDIATGGAAGLFVINNFLDMSNPFFGANDYHDFNVYRQSDLAEEHGKLTTQTDEELFTSGTGTEDTYVWYPLLTSDLIGNGIKLRDEDSADKDHPLNYRLVLETHPIDDHVDGDSFLPTDFLNPRGRWDVGAIAYYPQNKIMYGICPNSGGDFKVAGRCALLDGILYTTTNQNHALMGIGARVIYDGATVVTVVGKLAENQWMVLTLTGAKPADTTDLVITTIQHAFGSLSTFEAGFSGNLGTSDLTSAEVSMHGVCYCEQAGSTVDNTAVTFDGTTCNETYQLYIYTPYDTVRQCNFQHRVTAGGVWDATKYRLEVAAQLLATSDTVLQVINFEGIQFHMSSAAAAHISSIYLYGAEASSTIIASCVIRVADVNANWLRTAIRLDQGSAVLSHCVIYLIGLNAIQVDFNGVISDGASSFLDAYFCTVYGWTSPFVEAAGSTLNVYNSALIGNNAVCSSLSDQDYNVYDIAEGEVHGHLTAQADAALFTAVAGGRETWDWTPLVGSDLIFRARHFNNYTQDLDNQPGFRYQGIAPDAGALELGQAVSPFGICPNCPADFQSAGTVLVTVLDGIATFDVPQTNVLMGVGANVDYGAGPAQGYVKEMINPFQFILVTGAGAAAPNAADQAVNAITHPFASQSAAEAGYAALTGNADLVAADYQLWLPCYCEQAAYTVDAAAAEYDGPTCDFGHWIKIWQTFSTIKESIMQHRAVNNGIWDATKYRHEMAGNPSIDIHDTSAVISYILFEGLQIHNSTVAAGNRSAVVMRGQNGSCAILNSCVIRFSDGSDPRFCVAMITSEVSTGIVINCLFVQPEINHADSAGILMQVKDFLDCYNSGFLGCSHAIDGFAGGTINLRNNFFLDTDTANSDIADSDYNLYRENNEGDANGRLSIQTNVQLFTLFDAVTVEDTNWTPGPGSDLIDSAMTGVNVAIDFAFMLQGDLDHPFETEWRPQDMPGQTRYDIGPLEKAFAGSRWQWYHYW